MLPQQHRIKAKRGPETGRRRACVTTDPDDGGKDEDKLGRDTQKKKRAIWIFSDSLWIRFAVLQGQGCRQVLGQRRILFSQTLKRLEPMLRMTERGESRHMNNFPWKTWQSLTSERRPPLLDPNSSQFLFGVCCRYRLRQLCTTWHSILEVAAGGSNRVKNDVDRPPFGFLTSESLEVQLQQMQVTDINNIVYWMLMSILFVALHFINNLVLRR